MTLIANAPVAMTITLVVMLIGSLLFGARPGTRTHDSTARAAKEAARAWGGSNRLIHRRLAYGYPRSTLSK
jgi:hypothetical protein